MKESPSWFGSDDESQDDAAGDGCPPPPFFQCGYGGPKGAGREGRRGSAATSSRAWVPEANQLEEEDEEDRDGWWEDAALSVKVKLLHAGGWSESSGSEGHRTPPTPAPASSSQSAGASGTRELAQQGGGLDADHVEQFTVSFVSDSQLHEELEEISALCTFCLDDMKIGEELCRLPCMHTFHRRCVHAWLERDRRCMLCRLDITRPCG
jgi:hypothetical protein